MNVKLKKWPKNPIIIDGFPGFGLVGTIATEFLIEHLKTEQIGKIVHDESPVVVAIHENKVVEPFGIFYNKKYNIVIVHAISAVTGFEWSIAKIIDELAKSLKAKEVISLEGVGSSNIDENLCRIFYYSNNEKSKKKFESIKVLPLKEGIIMGVTGAILLKIEKVPVSCIFAESHTNMPDSKAAAKIIETLDKYLGLAVDYKPLLEQAEKFENKLKGLLEKSKEAEDLAEKKKLNYVG